MCKLGTRRTVQLYRENYVNAQAQWETHGETTNVRESVSVRRHLLLRDADRMPSAAQGAIIYDQGQEGELHGQLIGQLL